MQTRFQAKHLVAIGLLIIVLGLVYSFYIHNKKPASVTAPIMTMAGHITEVNTNAIMVQGFVGGASKSIEFAITPQTLFQSNAIKMTITQLKSGKPFHPQTIIAKGKASDLVSGMTVRITAQDDLLTHTRTTAKQIIYMTHDISF